MFDPNYTILRQHLTKLQGLLDDRPINKQSLLQVSQQLAALWQTELVHWEGQGLSSEQYGRWRSLHTEIHRELRLLNVDLLFLQSSRSLAGVQQKQQQIGDRLRKLLQYCDLILNLEPNDIPEA